MTIFLFLFLVFFTSTIVLFFFPDILNPTASTRDAFTDTYTYSNSFGFGFGVGGFNFFSYDLTMLPTIIKDFIRVAAATFLDIDLNIGKWFGGGGAREPARPARERYSTGRGPRTGGGAFKTKVQTDRWGNVLSTAPLATDGRSQGLIARLFTRFMLGLSTLGIVSFLQMLMSMSLFAPLQLASGRLFRQRRRDGDGRRGLDGIAAVMIAVFVAVGVARSVTRLGSKSSVKQLNPPCCHRTIFQVYQATAWLAHFMLSRFETAILDVDGRPHYARNDYRYRDADADENLTMRELAVRWAAETAVRWDPRRLWAEAMAGRAGRRGRPHID